MKKVVVVGAGFSGFCAAYFLSRKGYAVEVVEKESRSGGLIRTVTTQWGRVETAANGILNSLLFEEICREVDLKVIPTQKTARRRYIFREHPRRWPLTFAESIKFFIKFIFCRDRKPKPFETISEWGKRVVGTPATTFGLGPVLQGIYAGDAETLSASLILARFFQKKKAKPKVRGLVAPANGMGEFFEKMESYLSRRGVRISYNCEFDFENKRDAAIVLACSVQNAAQLMEKVSADLNRELMSIEVLSLVKATTFYSDERPRLKGFGVLFPKESPFRSLGVLFNNFIFAKTSPHSSESYVMGGYKDGALSGQTDAKILEQVKGDHEGLSRSAETPVGFHIQRWPQAIPLYSVALEGTLPRVRGYLENLEKQSIFFLGNYLGGIGLSQLLERAQALAERI
jgi:oxygen-dependent protoporphyrinogen oxidase